MIKKDYQQSFIDAIGESLNDDSIRLIYADWLDENGEEELAEFIRIQIELNKYDNPILVNLSNMQIERRSNRDPLLNLRVRHWEEETEEYLSGWVEPEEVKELEFRKSSSPVCYIMDVPKKSTVPIRGSFVNAHGSDSSVDKTFCFFRPVPLKANKEVDEAIEIVYLLERQKDTIPFCHLEGGEGDSKWTIPVKSHQWKRGFPWFLTISGISAQQLWLDEGRRIFREFPTLERIEMPDVELLNETTRMWFRGIGSQRCMIREGIFDRLCKGRLYQSSLSNREYPNEQMARDDLSNACLLYAKGS